MSKIYFHNLEKYYNQEITLEGFVDNIRDLPYVQFLILRDSSDKVQVTIEKNKENKHHNDIVSNLTLESTVKVTGILYENEKVKMGGKELIPTDILVTSTSESELPIDVHDKEKVFGKQD